jgi:FkbM family methyltransferase
MQGAPPAGATVIPRKFSAHYLQRFHFAAQTVFDVGVGRGTPPLYRLFAGRKLVLIDPLPETEAQVRDRFPDLAFEFFPVALGAAEGTATLNLTRNAAKVGIPERTALTAEDIAGRRPVKVTTLDRIVAETAYPEPFGLKLDTEGCELDILRGAERALGKTEFVIAELSIRTRFVGGYRFSDAVGFLGDRGFELIDILNFQSGIARFYDCLFLRRGHPLFAGAA